MPGLVLPRCAMGGLSRVRPKRKTEGLPPKRNAGNDHRNFYPSWNSFAKEKCGPSVWLIVFCAAPLLAIFAPTFSLGYGERMIAM